MLNRVSLVGRITRDIELRNSINGKYFVAFTLAVNNNFNNSKAAFIPCFAWNKTAENMAKYLKKGSLIALDGRLQTRTETNNNQIKTIVQIVADIVSFLDNRTNINIKLNKKNNINDFSEFNNLKLNNNEIFEHNEKISEEDNLLNNNNNNNDNDENIIFNNNDNNDDNILWD